LFGGGLVDGVGLGDAVRVGLALGLVDLDGLGLALGLGLGEVVRVGVGLGPVGPFMVMSSA